MRKPLAHLGKSAAFKKALVIRICIPESESAIFHRRAVACAFTNVASGAV
jgi:hypothetical protein